MGDAMCDPIKNYLSEANLSLEDSVSQVARLVGQ